VRALACHFWEAMAGPDHQQQAEEEVVWPEAVRPEALRRKAEEAMRLWAVEVVWPEAVRRKAEEAMWLWAVLLKVASASWPWKRSVA